jgi:hypothetical protein
MTKIRKHLEKLSMLPLALAGLVLPSVAHAQLTQIAAGSFLDAILLLPGYFISFIVMPTMSLLVYLSGIMLNWSIQYSVLDMKANYATTNVEAIWTVIRDLANMGFIFVLLYTAIMTIFGKGEYQKTIRNMVIAALLINFSLFITEAVIDAANVLSLLFYKAISAGGLNATTGLASSFMDVFGITNLYHITDALKGTQLTIMGVAGSVIMLIVSFSFMAAAVMFMIRFVVLLLVIALSPIMFVGMIIPGMDKNLKTWKDTLIGQAFFAPVYFALTWVALMVARGLVGTSGINLSGAILGSAGGVANTDAVGTLVKFFIIIALLMAALMQAKSIAGKSPAFVNNLTKSALGYAGGATIGVAGRFGRGTLGRAGSALANSESVKNAIERGGASGAAGRLALLAGNKASKSSFDLRGTGFGATLGAGKVKKGTSFEQDVKDRNKAALERAKYLKPSDEVLKPLKEAEDKARDDFDAELAKAGYNKPEELTKAEDEFKASNKRNKGESQEDWDDRKEEAKKKLEEARAADAPVREKLAKDNPTLATAKTVYDEASAARKKVDERSERFIAKESEPTITFAKPITDASATLKAISEQGLGGYMVDQQRATPLSERNPLMKPLAWLGNATAPIINLRRQERLARVEAIRKEMKKKKNEVAEAIEKLNKKDEGGGGGGGDGEKKDK